MTVRESMENKIVKLHEFFIKPFEAAVNKAASIVETIRLLGEISRDLKELRKDVLDIKSYLARQEEIAKVMIEQGTFVEEDDFFGQLEDDIDKKDIN